MKRLPSALLTVLAVIASVYLWGTCQYRSGAADARLRDAGDSTDARVAQLAADQLEREAAWARTLKRQNVESDIFRHRADSLQNEVMAARNQVVTGSDTLVPKPLVVAALAAKDSLIASADRQVAFYQSIVATYRDTIVPALQRFTVELTAQREAWRHKAERRFACFAGPGATASLGGKVVAGVTVGCGIRL